MRNIDIVKTEILFNQLVYLKDYLEKNNTNQNCESSMFRIEEKWLKFFADTKPIDQKLLLMKLCEYVLAFPAHNANVERIFSLMSSQRKKQVVTGDNLSNFDLSL